jgi:hypothetical protein
MRCNREGAMIAKKCLTLGFALLLPATLAMPVTAQDKPRDQRSAADSKAPAAPVGHRQPTAADIAKAQADTSDPEREKRDRALDKRLQICRGC